MTTDPLVIPQSPRAILLTYRVLLGQYIRSSNEKDKKDRQLIKNLRDARKRDSEPVPPEEKVGFLAFATDLFGTEIVDRGGTGVLESLFLLDAGTLAALIEWNRINLLRVGQKQFIRRSVVFLIATLGVVATLAKLNAFDNPIVKEVLRTLALGLLRPGWVTGIFLIVAVILELVIWQPGKLRLEEFDQLLAVAFAYVSKVPSPVIDKTNKVPKEVQFGEE